MRRSAILLAWVALGGCSSAEIGRVDGGRDVGPPDASQPDAGDGGAPGDAGATDAGGDLDAGAGMDSGAAPDARTDLDAGPPPDAATFPHPLIPLVDDFMDMTPLPLWSDGSMGPASSVEDGTLNMSVTGGAAGGSYHFYQTTSTYDLVGRAVILELVELPADSRVAALFTVEVGLDNRNRIGFELLGGNLETFAVEMGTRRRLATRARDVADRWLMIRHDGTQLRLASSPDGWAWAEIGGPATHGADFHAVIVEISILVATGGSTSAARFRSDNLDIPPPPP